MPSIINYGSCCIDHVFQVPHFVAPGETLSSTAYSIFPGGKGLNQSIAMAKAGAAVIHVGAIGRDGLWLSERLSEVGVNINHLAVSDQPSGQAIIQVDSTGENAIVIVGGTNLLDHRTQLELALSKTNEKDYLLIQNETSSNNYAIKAAKQRGMKIVFNMAPMNAKALELPLELVDYFVVNETEGEALTGETSSDGICSAFLTQYPESAIILTLGAAGAIYCDQHQTLNQPAFAIDPIDTTGAGDTFTGFFLATLTASGDIQRALKTAAAAAALAVTQEGAATSIPEASAVADLLAQRSSIHRS